MKKIDALLQKVEVFERLAVYGDRKSFLQAFAQEAQSFPASSAQGINSQYVPGTEPPINKAPEDSPSVTPSTDNTMYTPENNINTMYMPKDHIKVHRPAQYDQRVYNVQHFINKQLVPAGVIFPIDEDGKWGPKTADALKMWGSKNNLSGVPLNAVFTAAQTQASKEPTTMQAFNPGPSSNSVASK